MSDQLIRAISRDGYVKAAAVSTRELTERARQIHKTLPVATAALGRALAAASMMGNALKEDGESVTLQIKGGGPLGTVLAVSDNAGNVRGTVDEPAVDLPLRPDGKLDVGAAVGHEGTLTVIRDLNMKEPYVGSVGLLGGEIAEDLAAYFAESEQIPTACGVTALLREDPDPETMLRKALSDFDLEILEKSPIGYRCTCSRERMERALISLGAEELQTMIDEQGHADLTCRFCDNVQHFSREDLEAMVEGIRKKSKKN